MDDFVERVARAIEYNCPFTDESLSMNEIREVARAAIAECFKLRDMKDAPDNKEILSQDEAGYWYLLHKNHGEWMADDGSLPDFPLVGWLPLPEQKKTPG